jgi:hypothetical protein
MKNIRNGIIATAFAASAALATILGATAPAMAQDAGYVQYNAWQPAWDQGQFDHKHIILGTVVDFHPYRLSVRTRNGRVRHIDLKNGTVIRPRGATPQPGNHVAVEGYRSHGTFVANRLVLR